MKSRLKRHIGPVWLRTCRGRYEATMPDGCRIKVRPWGPWWLAGRQLPRRPDGTPGVMGWRTVKARRPGYSLRRSAMLVALEMWRQKSARKASR